MRFATQMTVHVPRQSVWDFLWDVPRLTACVPGCEAVEEIEPGTRYQAVVRDKVGPFTLRVPLAVEVLEATAPTRLRARAQGRDTAVQSLVKVDLTLVLVEPSAQTTTLQVEAEVTVLGKLGTLGHSVVVRRGEAIVAQFANAIQAALDQEVT
jgi:carbon monoxide dehydrogenase subunit G